MTSITSRRRLCQPGLLDVVIGLRARPSELATSWKRADPQHRLGALVAVIEDRSPLDDDTLFRELCKR